ncbi:MAG: terminase, partial [Mesorhizobium sp.]
MRRSAAASAASKRGCGRSSMIATYLALLEEMDRRRQRNLLAAYRPYQRQSEFHAAGAKNRERLFMA